MGAACGAACSEQPSSGRAHRQTDSPLTQTDSDPQAIAATVARRACSSPVVQRQREAKGRRLLCRQPADRRRSQRRLERSRLQSAPFVCLSSAAVRRPFRRQRRAVRCGATAALTSRGRSGRPADGGLAERLSGCSVGSEGKADASVGRHEPNRNKQKRNEEKRSGEEKQRFGGRPELEQENSDTNETEFHRVAQASSASQKLKEQRLNEKRRFRNNKVASWHDLLPAALF